MKIIHTVLKLLPHLCIILALCFITFAILDWYNPMMAFTTNTFSGILMLVFCAVSIVSSVAGLIGAKRR